MYEHTNAAVEKFVHALTFENKKARLNTTDIILVSLLLLATLMIATIFVPAALYNGIYERHQRNKRHKQLANAKTIKK